ncbi:MAG: orotate phosphoribosyltransferase [Micavibrio sp.]|nr:orotate phosphoribosyltransferase [Micavibrio sp.]HCK33080.1 orotate phosphoribosyltransferase [Rhodospirillaceae bacterium]|tara:strand:- start:351 stop:1049 length:699 start_codon:yes stop_codon:yes gene_type:complete
MSTDNITFDADYIAKETAKTFLDTQSILFNADEPFRYTSGRVGPVYIDCRRIISFPKERSRLMDFGADMLKNNVGLDNMDALAGGETAGIPYAAFISERLNKPMLYVRKKPKGFGRMAQLEGYFEENQNIVLIEDLQNYGKSSGIFVDVIRKAGGNISDLFVLFQYGISDIPKKNMDALNMKVHALTNWWSALETAKEMNYFDAKTIDAVESFLHNPVQWSIDNGGAGEDAA